jgi:hypothetical protein
VTGSGEDIYGTLDEFRFVYQPASGNCDITARVFSVQNADPWAEAGVMIRATLNSTARKVASLVTFSNGVTLQRRSSTGGLTSYTRTTGLTAPYWVRLVRSGNTFTGYSRRMEPRGSRRARDRHDGDERVHRVGGHQSSRWGAKYVTIDSVTATP